MGPEHRGGGLLHICFGLAMLAACQSCDRSAQAQQPLAEKVGSTYQVTRTTETSATGSDGSSSTSHGTDTLLERVIEVRPNGTVLEYDLPPDAKAEERAREWRFPARVFMSSNGQYSLLNADQMKLRVDDWLKAAKWSRAACGRLVFTWNVFRIECDPQSVLKFVKNWSLRWPVPQDGAIFSDERAAKPTVFRRVNSPSGNTFVAEMVIDGDRVRREEAEADMIVAELSRQPITFDSAYQAHVRDEFKGTLRITFEADPSGTVNRRKTVKLIETKRASGVVQHATETESVERRPSN